MIQLSPLEGRANYQAIMALYDYMVARAVPFVPEDVFSSDTFYVQGDLSRPASVTDFHKLSGTRPRERTASYMARLRDYGIDESNIRADKRRANDARLAKEIIRRASDGVPEEKSLYAFLYGDMPREDYHVLPDRLHRLLNAYMDEDSLKAEGLLFDVKECPELLDDVFRYARFSDKSLSIRLFELLNVPVCPYCNRNFTTTVSKKGGMRQGEFDHYRSKSKYPWFALSIRNLIPSCPSCNHNKRDEDALILYPYKEGLDSCGSFRTVPVNGLDYLTGTFNDPDDFRIAVKKEGKTPLAGLAERMENSLNLLRLEELYNSHKEFVSSIFQKRYIFPETYLQSVYEEFEGLFSSVQDVRDMFYMRHVSPESWGEHPLSKLVHDIDEEITELEEYARRRTGETRSLILHDKLFGKKQ